MSEGGEKLTNNLGQNGSKLGEAVGNAPHQVFDAVNEKLGEHGQRTDIRDPPGTGSTKDKSDQHPVPLAGSSSSAKPPPEGQAPPEGQQAPPVHGSGAVPDHGFSFSDAPAPAAGPTAQVSSLHPREAGQRVRAAPGRRRQNKAELTNDSRQRKQPTRSLKIRKSPQKFPKVFLKTRSTRRKQPLLEDWTSRNQLSLI